MTDPNELIATALLLLHTLVAALYIILEYGCAPSTFAWLLLFIALPVIGIVIYHFARRAAIVPIGRHLVGPSSHAALPLRTALHDRTVLPASAAHRCKIVLSPWYT